MLAHESTAFGLLRSYSLANQVYDHTVHERNPTSGRFRCVAPVYIDRALSIPTGAKWILATHSICPGGKRCGPEPLGFLDNQSKLLSKTRRDPHGSRNFKEIERYAAAPGSEGIADWAGPSSMTTCGC